MRTSMRLRPVLIMLATLAAAAGAVSLAAPATAQTISQGRLSFSGDAGDYISQGLSWSYSTTAADAFTATVDTAGNHVDVAVTGANGDWWYLDLAAPAGQRLQPGTYAGAARYPFQAAGQPGLSLYGEGRGCNTLTGSFTVQDAVFDNTGQIQAFDATYEQHCEGAAAALRGDVHLATTPPPPPLTVGVTLSTTGTARKLDGTAVLGGSVTCGAAAPVTVTGTVSEVVHRTIVRGTVSTTVPCSPGAPVSWSATAVPGGSTPFQQGSADVSVTASAVDPYRGTTVTAAASGTVKLVKG